MCVNLARVLKLATWWLSAGCVYTEPQLTCHVKVWKRYVDGP